MGRELTKDNLNRTVARHTIVLVLLVLKADRMPGCPIDGEMVNCLFRFRPDMVLITALAIVCLFCHVWYRTH